MKSETSAGGIVIRDNQILVIHDAFGKWTFPKGLVEQGESFEAAALREVKEETGIRCEVVKYLGQVHYWYRNGSELVSKTVHYYLLRPTPQAQNPVPLLSEIKEAKWVTPEQLALLPTYENNKPIILTALTHMASPTT
ncbi:MAG: NUDIX hydrolase [Bacillota bacterium]